MAHGLCTDYPDWSIAAVGSEGGLRIGYEYGRFVTKVDLQLEPHLLEPDLHEDVTEEASSLVAASTEVCSISEHI
jgi:hypothetical protein